ncbi:disulfide oxidoreductase [Effusibacillus lacus]|uniref:disulfide oxidoreductase n=1 Tax=Effusibacillus lacus TaxID=1348429 RepID=UPI00312CB0B6
MSWSISIVAVLGSLYFSEVAGYVPCTLCWFQRIFMYPLAVILGIASYRGDTHITNYVLPFSIIGGSFSLYHYLEQKISYFGELTPCRVGIPCNVEYINWFGFITIPFLALACFFLITVIMWIIRRDTLHKGKN